MHFIHQGRVDEGGMAHTFAGSEKWTPLTPAVFHILLALADQDMHGYAIMQQIAHDTGGRFRMGPGTLYGSIKRMLTDNLIEECIERPVLETDDERRRYYRITETGHRSLQAEASRIARAVKIAQRRNLLPSRIRVRAARP